MWNKKISYKQKRALFQSRPNYNYTFYIMLITRQYREPWNKNAFLSIISCKHDSWRGICLKCKTKFTNKLVLSNMA